MLTQLLGGRRVLGAFAEGAPGAVGARRLSGEWPRVRHTGSASHPWPVSPDLPRGAVQRGDQGAQDRAAERPVRRLLPRILCVQSVLRLQRLGDCALCHHPVDKYGLRDGQGGQTSSGPARSGDAHAHSSLCLPPCFQICSISESASDTSKRRPRGVSREGALLAVYLCQGRFRVLLLGPL